MERRLLTAKFRYIGTHDYLLSEQGQLQAEQLGEALSVLPIVAVYSSPLQRAYRTAELIAARHALAVQVLDDLREGRFGSWEGMSRAEVLARSLQDEQQLLAWERDPDIVPPGGESFTMIYERALATVEQLAQMHVEQAIVLVSHVGVIKALLCAALGTPLTSFSHMFLGPGDDQCRRLASLVSFAPSPEQSCSPGLGAGSLDALIGTSLSCRVIGVGGCASLFCTGGRLAEWVAGIAVYGYNGRNELLPLSMAINGVLLYRIK